MPNGMDYSLLQRVIDGTGMILDTEPGTPDDVGTYVTEDQLADWIKGKILFTGYYHNGNFYSDSGHTTLLAKVNGALYIDQTNANKALYVCLSSTYQSLTEEAQVQAIIDGLNDGTIVPLKAKQDQNGNVIDQTYETKADASDLKAAIQGNSQRIENLEVAVSGSLVQTNTDATMANIKTITNSNEILPWAILKRVGARAVKFNQMNNNSGYRASVSTSGTRVTVTWDGQSDTKFGVRTSIIPQGHKVYIRINIESVSVQNLSKIRFGDAVSFGTSVGEHEYIATTTVDYGVALFADSPNLVVGDNFVYSDFNVFDLTAMGEYDSTLTDAQNIAKFRAKFPASYYQYDTGHIYDLNPSAFKVVGKQKWDEVWEVGSINSSGGNGTATNCIRSKNYVPVIGGTTYYFETGFTSSGGFPIFSYYDANKIFISQENKSKNDSFVVPVGASFLRFQVESSYGTSYNHDIMICLNSVTDKTYEGYKETTIDTSFTSDYKYVNESCHDYSKNVLVNGVMRREEHKGIVGEKNLATLAWSIVTGTLWEATLDAKPVSSSDVVANIICDNYLTSYGSYLSQRVGEIAITTTGDVRVNNGSSSVSPTGTLLYELASPSTPTLHDPIPNIPCEDGTTVTAVTPQTDLVNSIDVPSTIAYMTKIGG